MRQSTLSLAAALFAATAVSAPLAAWDNPYTCELPSFPDVPAGFNECALVSHGIVAVCAGGNYCPDRPVSRAQAAMYLERAFRGTATWSPVDGWYSGGTSSTQPRITKVVSPEPGDAVGSGQRLLAAMAGIVDAGPDKPYLVKLEPGVYDVGTVLTIKQFVDLEGSGQGVTRIIGSPLPATAMVNHAANSELRHLTLGPTSTTGFVLRVLSGAGVGLRSVRHVTIETDGTGLICADVPLHLSHVRIESAEGSSNTALTATECDLLIEDSWMSARNGTTNMALAVHGDVTLRRSHVVAENGDGANRAVFVQEGTATLEDSFVRATGELSTALYLNDAHANVRRSELEVDSPADRLISTNGFVETHQIDISASRLVQGDLLIGQGNKFRIAHTQLESIDFDIVSGDTVTCFATFDENFENNQADPLTDCP